MADLIKLRRPNGKVRTYDVNEYDIPAMLKGGYRRAGSVMIAAHERSAPERKRTFTPREVQAAGIPAEFQNAPEPRKEPFLVSQIPNAAALVGDIGGRAVGGTIGGTVGLGGGPAAPGTVPAGVVIGQEIGGAVGSGGMAAGGEAVRQLIDQMIGAETPEDPMGEIGKAAAFNAGASLAGGAATHAVLKPLGKGAMAVATRATPEAVQAAIREGITATQGGVKKIAQRLGHYGDQVRQMTQIATRQGTQHDPVDIVQRAVSTKFRGQPSLIETLANNQTGDQSDIISGVRSELTRFLNRHGGTVGQGSINARPMTPIQLLKLKQDAQQISQPIYDMLDNAELAHLVSPANKLKAHTYRALRDAADEMLEQTLPKIVMSGKQTTYRDLMLAEQGLIQLKEAIQPGMSTKRTFMGEAARRALPTSAGAIIGGGIGAAGGGEHRTSAATTGAALGAILMNNPGAMSRAALALSNPAVAEALRLVPRLGVAAFTEQREPAR